jgi:dihydropteroate synthase
MYLQDTTGYWSVRGANLALSRPLMMGVVNITPDSFSDGGRFFEADRALAHARQLIDEGADIIDLGGESTRPGAAPVPPEEELRRVLPLVRALRDCGVPLSVDTSRPDVIRAALDAGAAIVNDVRALTEPGALDAAANSDCGIVLMHMRGAPRTMQTDPRYADVVGDVIEFLRQRRDTAVASGVARERIVLDPGFGFGKSVAHNYTLLKRLDALCALGQPVLAGLSRKSMLGAVSGRDVGARVFASVAAAVIAVERGARIVRVHDVAATRDALSVLQATEQEGAMG